MTRLPSRAANTPPAAPPTPAPPTPAPPVPAAAPSSPGKVVAAAFIGTALEWYDFFLFGTTAAIVFAPLFFPGSDPVASTVSAFLSFSAAFIARPVGALIFGHVGDKYGRRGALVATVMIMGAASTLMGLLPTYETAGVVAPVLLTLLRAVQGVATGGEWGGATLMAIEYAPAKRRGLYAALVQLGSPVGTLLSTGAITLVALLPKDDFMAWGWRLPFIASIVLVAVALWLRWNVEETPEFQELKASDGTTKAPVVELFRQYKAKLAIGVCTYLVGNAGFFILTTFMISYVTRVLGLPSTVILTAMTIGAVAQMVMTVLAGRLADRFGAARVGIIGYSVFIALAFPIFWLVDSRDPGLIILAMVLAFGPCAITYAIIGALIDRLFPAQVKYTGMGLSANLSAVVAGFMPALATVFLTFSGNASWGPASLLVVIGLISLGGAIATSKVRAA
ncbi:MFS transporter [Arthrobacter sp. ISL-5]|uniref:MFS transporter n=1 Tax=Arthrobacter sp. ISL-5 TaxID=2819111 RepID=UPI001BE62127|nr:MFS transporter [Arthrobacter sp. ISL-5]MBT2552521.1 MHS family MFS transporter [Arthrobacter sp. ISL-5]